MKSEICPVGIYMFKVNKRNTRTRCKICSKIAIKTPERRQWSLSGVFIVNFEHISHLDLVFLLLTLNMQIPTGSLSHHINILYPYLVYFPCICIKYYFNLIRNTFWNTWQLFRDRLQNSLQILIRELTSIPSEIIRKR